MPEKDKLSPFEPDAHYESLYCIRGHRPLGPRQPLVRTQEQRHMTPGPNIRVCAHRSLGLSRYGVMIRFPVYVAHAFFQIC